LTDSEAQAFADLLGQILPNSLASSKSKKGGGNKGQGGGVFDLFGSSQEEGEGVGKVQAALESRSLKKKSSLQQRGGGKWMDLDRPATRGELSNEEELELDRMREELGGLRDEREVLKWGYEKVFGYSREQSKGVVVDPSLLGQSKKGVGISSRLYPELLLHLFLTLRDGYQSPYTALAIFKLASSNPYSYISGCTSLLYYEVLKTRWQIGQGDVEGVLEGLEEMLSGGVKLDMDVGAGEKIKELVRAIGESIKIDRERAEGNVRLLEEKGGFEGELDAGEREKEVGKRRWFGGKEVRSWTRMEWLLEGELDEAEEKRRVRKEENWKARERESGMYEQEQEDEYERGDEVFGGKPDLYSHRPAPVSTSHSPSTNFHTPRPSRLSPLENNPFPRSQLSSHPSEDLEDDFSEREREGEGEGRRLNFKERDALRGLPKRPSFANVYKIRRQSLTKDEKSRKDQKHPLLFWKQ